VITLQISATPYNLLTQYSRIPQVNEQAWFGKDEDSNYYGLPDYVAAMQDPISESGTISKCDAFERRATKEQSSMTETDDQNGKRKKARVAALACEYIEALGTQHAIEAQINDANCDKSPTTLTQRMIKGLIQSPRENGDGTGIMILIRVANRKHGTYLARTIREQRDRLHLHKRFAVVVDVDAKSTGLKSQIEPAFQEQMRVWRGLTSVDKLVVTAYSDLKDLPCILILVEKGKMGDTFPDSLRYYDLRLRYDNDKNENYTRASMEQDLGRAFRYQDVSKGAKYPLPTILVSAVCYSILGSKRGGKQRQLLQKVPDKNDSMRRRVKSCMTTHPEHEFDMSTYRKCFEAGPKHFDYLEEGERPTNTMRFVLMGKPQIGKTGVYLHFIYLIWDAVKPTQPICPDDYVDETSDGGSESDVDPDPWEPAKGNVGAYPCIEAIQKLEFDHKGHEFCTHDKPCKICAPRPGKYGDPKVAELWQHYIDECKRPPLNCSECNPKHLTVAETTGKALKERETRENQAAAEQTKAARQASQTSHGTPSGRSAQVSAKGLSQKAKDTIRSKFMTQSAGVSSDSVDPAVPGLWEKVDVSYSPEQKLEGFLYLQRGVRNIWFNTTSLGLRLKPPSELPKNAIHFPILTPSAGRAFPVPSAHTGGKLKYGARLDLSHAMDPLDADAGRSRGECDYLQIVAVKAKELAMYMTAWPDFSFYCLPEDTNELGVGASRHYMKKLATKLCHEDFPYCLFMDDSVACFKGVTLAGDPLRDPYPFGEEPL
jgi:hypothetical protein